MHVSLIYIYTSQMTVVFKKMNCMVGERRSSKSKREDHHFGDAGKNDPPRHHRVRYLILVRRSPIRASGYCQCRRRTRYWLILGWAPSIFLSFRPLSIHLMRITEYCSNISIFPGYDFQCFRFRLYNCRLYHSHLYRLHLCLLYLYLLWVSPLGSPLGVVGPYRRIGCLFDLKERHGICELYRGQVSRSCTVAPRLAAGRLKVKSLPVVVYTRLSATGLSASPLLSGVLNGCVDLVCL